MTSEHYCEIAGAKRRFWAVCECGWEGEHRSSMYDAQVDEYHHLTANGVDADAPQRA